MKKIKNFDLVCQNLGIPIIFIRKIEKSSKKFNGKIYIIGGNVRDLILNKPARTLTCRNLSGATGDMQRIKMPDGRRKRLIAYHEVGNALI